MMTLAEIRLLMDRRIAALNWTIVEMMLELATLEAERRHWNQLVPNPEDSMPSDLANS